MSPFAQGRVRRGVCLALALSALGPAGCRAVELRPDVHPLPRSLWRNAVWRPPSLVNPLGFLLRPWCRHHIKNPPHPNSRHVKVLAFGDSWAEMGPSHGMLQDMFTRHGVNARVELVATSGTEACEWAEDAQSLVKALDFTFKGEAVDYVWLSLGGNDLKIRKYKNCVMATTTMDARRECQRDFVTNHINPCLDSLLTAMWETEKYKDVKVVQCGYDFACEHALCPFIRGHANGPPLLPECADKAECRRRMMMTLQDLLLNKANRKLKGHDSKFTGINILGVLQGTDPSYKGSLGNPNVKKGVPCSQTFLCDHPMLGKAGAHAIGEAFWSMYFEGEQLVKQVQAEHVLKNTTRK